MTVALSAAIHGYRGSLLERDCEGVVEVTVITWWDSLESVRVCGEAVETAVVHDTAARMLVDFDRTCRTIASVHAGMAFRPSRTSVLE